MLLVVLDLYVALEFVADSEITSAPCRTLLSQFADSSATQSVPNIHN